MASSLSKNIAAYVLSIGGHLSLLAVLAVNLQYAPPKPDPIIQATLYFDQPKRSVTPKTKTRTAKKKSVKNVKGGETAKTIVKPRIKSLDKTAFDTKSTAMKSRQPTASSPLPLKGFLRANDFTRKKNLPPPPKTKAGVAPKPPSLSEKQAAFQVPNPAVPSSATQKPPEPTAAEKPTSTNSETKIPTFDIDPDSELGGDSVFSQRWRELSETKIHKKTIALKVSSNWTIPPIAISQFEIRIAVHIDKYGVVRQQEFVQSADLAILNVAAERAIKLSEPFDPLPDSIATGKETYKVVLRFVPDNTAN